MATYIEKLNTLNTTNESAKSAIANAVKRISDNNMTERAQRLLFNFCVVAASSALSFDASITLQNVYAVEKCTKILRAMHFKSASYIDKYTQTITHNMLKRTANKHLNNREQNASLCARLECETLFASAQKLHKAESTASTQSSSSRVALRALQIADYNESEKDLILSESDNAKAFVEMLKS